MNVVCSLRIDSADGDIRRIYPDTDSISFAIEDFCRDSFGKHPLDLLIDAKGAMSIEFDAGAILMRQGSMEIRAFAE